MLEIVVVVVALLHELLNHPRIVTADQNHFKRQSAAQRRNKKLLAVYKHQKETQQNERIIRSFKSIYNVGI